MTTPTPLSYEVLVLDGAQRAGDQRMPNGDPIVSSPLSVTLIQGERDAVLVDPPFTHEQIKQVGDWIERSGKRLAYIYATHGHGDHWFGTAELTKRFPGATVYATEGTIRLMRQQATQGREQLWDQAFPGQIPPTPVLAQPIPADGFLLEGNVVRAVEAGHTDTDDTTILHVPSIGLVVAGDVAYNGVHPYILEGGDGGLIAWLAAIDRIAALKPRAVVAGHKNRDRADDPAILEETRQYLRDAQRLLTEKPSPREFFDAMLQLHPDRLNPGPLWYGALGLLG
ncbi:MBL fold metallo-hydrolase [Kitasatospora kifunensis]|uniref:Glyoxylase-like metal-dependent hydrolase (Beta-lactamase superfamily II) n=1 Tax=Kitasatospora kifunensis TaxID=58351 RepID=A0A7W7R8W6_KITKI|nr:MBL fold metallo-hydrolase [Kitasatospora kifunensis]MBB4927573.1 glyoxylase-like metal-dependent hydrolase (beta-lactamase superfamily II) [Kitasatospora kifunensis]